MPGLIPSEDAAALAASAHRQVFGAADYGRDPSYQAALLFANKLRAKADLPELVFLPRSEGCRFVLEVAVPAMFAMRWTHAWMPGVRGREAWPCSEAVQRFMADYDVGRYPDLLPLPGVKCEHDSHRPSCPQSAFFRRASAG